MNSNFSLFKYLFTILASLHTLFSHAYNLRQLTSENGLSNSAIQSICQDFEGYMWFGTCDGLNMYDGHSITVYKPTDGTNTLSGNLIESILEAENGIFWIQTNYGLNRFDKKQRNVDYFREFNGKNHIIKDLKHNITIFQDSSIYFYLPERRSFQQIPTNIHYNDVLNITIDTNNNLWIFAKNGKSLTYKINRKPNGEVSIIPVSQFYHNAELLYCFNDGINTIYFVDTLGLLYEYNLTENQKKYIYNLKNEILEKSHISSIIKHQADYLVGFKTNGLLRLVETNQSNSFSVQEMDIKSGIFCLFKDKNQDIIWVGTDGQGIYIYSTESYSIKSHVFGNLVHKINKPVRALFLDQQNTLWIGTKGDGILKISDFDYKRNIDAQHIEHVTSSNSQLKNNSVYAFAKSSRNIIWIGHDDGLSYYSIKEKRIKKLKFKNSAHYLKYIHSIYELNDSTLWLASVGEGMVKVVISGTEDNPVVESVLKVLAQNGEFALNYFFTLYHENDSTLWFGNRGYGAYKINTVTQRYVTMTFDRGLNFQTMNDIFSIVKDKNNNYWFGTSYGLIKFNNGIEKVFNEQNGFPNNTIHAIQDDGYNNLWLSTNQGIIRFNIEDETFQVYNQFNGLNVTEFSDGAFLNDPKTGNLLFGGINGFVTITKNKRAALTNYMPGIHFSNLTIFGKDHNIYDYLKSNRESNVLKLNHSQNFFSVRFTAIDYLNGNNYTYLYKLEGLHNHWIENGSSGLVSFTNIPPGNYILHIKYRNQVTKVESKTHLLEIAIRPPWYRTKVAYAGYFIIYVFLILFVFRTSKKWYKLKKDATIAKINEQKKVEVYESKLRFFTNITHELCTPLTLINGPCEKILTNSTDDYTKKYASTIQRNAEKLNTLIQELIEFRRIETGNKPLEVQPIPISLFTHNLAESFNELAEAKSISYHINIENISSWNTDPGCFTKITTNLLSNAFKYTPESGEIIFNLSLENEHLVITVSNTGKGIKPEDIADIFDRYKILDNLEGSAQKGNFSQNGLGLAICKSLTLLMKGEIKVESSPGEITHFKVTLPNLTAHDISNVNASEIIIPIPEKPFTPSNTESKPFEKGKPRLMIVDDDPEMLWFLSEVFTENYNIIAFENSNNALAYLRQNQTDLVISDVMMPEIDGIQFTKIIKSDKSLQHIPLVLLSAKNTPEDQVSGLESGAELYLTKPFNVSYLEKVVERLLKRESDLKNYYKSALSAFTLEEGRFLHNEDRVFYESILKIIHENISDSDLGPDFISHKLGMSTRSLYRKLKEITNHSISELIKDFRFEIVERLLISTNLSVDEIIFKAGFTNRGNFFKLFSQKHGVTPKSYREQRKSEYGDILN